MKKALVVLLALVALVAFAYAGTQPKVTGKVVVKTMAYGDNSNAEGVNWVRIVDAFQKANPNITIDYEMLYDEAYHQKVVARIASGDYPDLAYMGADARWGKQWADAKLQYDHKAILAKSKQFDLNLIPAMGPNGEIWEVPLGTANLCTVLFMNIDLVKSLGFGEPKTYEDLVAMVPKAKAAGLDVVSIDGADGWAWGSCLMSGIIARLSGDGAWVQKAVAGTNKFTDKAFVDGLNLIGQMVKDGVISDKAVLVDYGGNTAAFGNGKALFMVQGQWAAGDAAKAGNVSLIAWPKLPGEKANMAGSIAGAVQVGYGVTSKGAKDANVLAAALKFIEFFNSTEEVTQRLRDGAIVGPILKGYVAPEDLPAIIKAKIALAQKTKTITDVIDAYLSGAPNDALNAGMQKIASGTATGEEVAAEVEGLLRK